jgi:hypothetical protein
MSTTTKTIIIDNDVFTYRRLRRAIGMLGVALPVVLVAFSLVPFFQTTVQPSISHYYYTNFREIFTGTLCAVGLFLIRYKGHNNPSILKNDNLLTNIAGAMAFGVAFVPTNPADTQDKIYTLIPSTASWLGWLHYSFAGLFFLILSIIAIKIFTIGQEKNENIPVSIFNENNIYRVCGYAILLFIVLVPISARYHLFSYSTLTFEALALFAFGTAWLIKGRALGDQGKVGEKLYREHNPVSTEEGAVKVVVERKQEPTDTPSLQ